MLAQKRRTVRIVSKCISRITCIGILSTIMFFGLIVSAQDQQQIDSLLTITSDKQADALTRFDANYNIAQILVGQGVDSAVVYANRTIDIARKHKAEKYLARGFQLLGEIYLRHNELDSAQLYLEKCAAIVKDKPFEEELSQVYVTLGSLYLIRGHYINALEQYQNGLKIVEEKKDTIRMATYYGNIGTIQFIMENEKMGLNYLHRALDIQLSNSLYNSAIVTLTSVGLHYLEGNDLVNAELYFKQGLELIDSCTRVATKIKFYINIGKIEKLKGNYAKSIEYFNASLSLSENYREEEITPKEMLLAHTYAELGNTYYLINKYDKAFDHFYKGLSYCHRNQFIDAYQDITNGLALLYESEQIADSALSYFKLYKEASDSILNNENVREIAKLEMKYQHEKELEYHAYQEEIQKKKTQLFQTTTISISAVLIALALGFVLIYQSKKNQLKKSKLLRESLQKDLVFKNKELTTKAIYLLRKQELIQTISQRLTAYIQNAKNRNIADLREIQKELKDDVTKKDWKEFELRFNEVHDDFYDRLRMAFTELTQNDLKLCAFLKLGMSTKEIATITFQSINSINVARYRLRKKLKLETEVNLNTFLSEF